MNTLGFSELEVEASIPLRFDKVVEKYADKIAIIDGHISMTYRQLDDISNQVAQEILSQQKNRSLPVVIFLPHGLEPIIAILGVLKAGLAYVAVDLSLPSENLQEIIDDTETDCILTNNQLQASTPFFAESGCSILTLEKIKAEGSKHKPHISISPEMFAAIFYTSGSTGKPKGVVWSHRAVLHGARISIKQLPVTSEDRHTLFFSCSAAASVSSLFSVLLIGGTLCPYSIREGNVEDLVRWLIEQEITIFYSPTAFFRKLVETLTEKNKFLKIRLILVGGQTLYKNEAELFKTRFSEKAVLINRLALSEGGGLTCFFIDQQTELSTDTVPAGYATEDKEIFLTDDSGQEVSPGTIGEIRVRSRYLASGYWRNPQLTDQKFLPSPTDDDKRILITGDLGRFSPDGCLEYLGRKDNMVKIRGYRVETEAIDAALCSLEVVKEAVVVAQEDFHGEKRLIAYLVPRAHSTPAISELRRSLADSLPEYMIPSFFVIMEALPLNQNGKVVRSELPPPDFSRPKLEEPYIAPRNEVEERLVVIWQKVLAISPVGVRDDFQDLGGESLLAVQLILEVEKSFGKVFQAEALSSFSTVEEMAWLIGSTSQSKVNPGTGRKQNRKGKLSSINYQRLSKAMAWATKMVGGRLQSCLKFGSDGQRSKRSQLPSKDYLRMLAVITRRKNGPIKPGSLITGINTSGVKRPLFWCANGYVGSESIGKRLNPEQPLYGLFTGSGILFPRPKLIDQPGREKLPGIFKMLATYYVEEILAIDPDGPYTLGGHCAGGKLAIEIVMQLQEKGKKVDRLSLIEVFDSRLYDYHGKIQLLYGDQSHLHAYKPFRWGESGWEKSFKSIPLVDWLPGPHGQFLAEPTVRITAKKIVSFLEANP